jgi:hypothetical protein
MEALRVILPLLKEKFSFDPEFYSAFPISHILSSGCVSNICLDLYPVLEDNPEFENYMRELPDTNYGFIPFTLGLNESIIGLIPLFEKGLIDFKIDATGQGVYILDFKNPKMREIYDMLKPLASGSLVYGVYAKGFLTDSGIWAEKGCVREYKDRFERGRKLGYKYGLFIQNLKEWFEEVSDTVSLKGYLELYPPEKRDEAAKKCYAPKYTLADPYRIWSVNPWMGGNIMVWRMDNPDADKQVTIDPRLKIALDEALNKYASPDEVKFVEEMYPGANEWYDWNNPIYVRKREILKRVAVKDGREWYKKYWNTVKAVRDIVSDISPKRELRKIIPALRILQVSIAEAYIYYYKFFWFTLSFPLYKAQLRLLRDYLEVNYGIKFDWDRMVKEALGTLASAGLTVVAGKYAEKYKGYGFDLQKMEYRQAPSKPRERMKRFRIFRKEKKREDFEFHWLRYRKALDEARNNLDMFEKFKQTYYLNKALESYEEAKRILYDMRSRYRKDEEKYDKIIDEMIALESQINDLREFIKKIRKS